MSEQEPQQLISFKYGQGMLVVRGDTIEELRKNVSLAAEIDLAPNLTLVDLFATIQETLDAREASSNVRTGYTRDGVPAANVQQTGSGAVQDPRMAKAVETVHNTFPGTDQWQGAQSAQAAPQAPQGPRVSPSGVVDKHVYPDHVCQHGPRIGRVFDGKNGKTWGVYSCQMGRNSGCEDEWPPR